MSLAGALEEYLKDPHFEQTRLELMASKAAAEDNQSASLKSALKKDTKGPIAPISISECLTLTTLIAPASPSVPPVPKLDAVASSSSSLKPEQSKDMVDFFTSIEEEQQKMFNSPTGRYVVH